MLRFPILLLTLTTSECLIEIKPTYSRYEY